MSWPTTRKHPRDERGRVVFSRDIATHHKQVVKRTLAQAFPRDHACAVEHYRPPLGRWADLARAVVCVLACAAIGALAAQGLN